MKIQVRPGRFKLAWFVAGVAVIPLSVTIVALSLMAIDLLNPTFANSLFSGVGMPSLAIYWLVNGCCVGFLQKIIVKRYLGVDLGLWTVYSALGALLAGVFAYPCLDGSCLPPQFSDFRLSSDVVTTVESSIVVLIYLTVFSAAQGVGLQRRARGAWRWVAAHLGSQTLVLLGLAAWLAAPGAAQYNMIITLALSVLAVTAVTAIVMQRMLNSNRAAGKKAHNEWAYQPAPAEPMMDSRRSIWDGVL